MWSGLQQQRERERENAKIMYTAHNKKKNLEKCAYSAHRYRIQILIDRRFPRKLLQHSRKPHNFKIFKLPLKFSEMKKEVLLSIENIQMLDDDGWIFVEDSKICMEENEEKNCTTTANERNVEEAKRSNEEEENTRPHVFVRIKNGLNVKIYLITNATIGWVLSESIRQSRVEFSNSIGISREDSVVTLDLSADVDILRPGETLYLVKCCLQDSDCVPHLGPL